MDSTTTKNRIKKLLSFVKTFDSEYNRKEHDQYVYRQTSDMFLSRPIAKGIEGSIYHTTFKDPTHFPYDVATKIINLCDMQETKNISKSIIKMTPDKLYKLFLSTSSVNQPCFTEIISSTLVNQLILQKICPNFTFNYYWEYDNSVMKVYNEFANGGDFHKWAQEEHSYDEWCNALFQIMVGLSSLKKYYNLLHTDLHTSNILVYKGKKGGYWTYTINGFKYYLPNLGYQFCIHDFGFAWIPQKMTIDWHYRDTLRHITKSGEHFYDIAHLLMQIFDTKTYKIPNQFKQFVDSYFLPEELNYTLAKTYYKHILQKQSIKTSYQGSGVTMVDKIYQLFHTSDRYDLSKRIRGNRIESYSLDKPLDKNKLPRVFRKFVE
jgi:hypothetical protein